MQDNKKQRNIVIAGIIFVVSIFMIVYLNNSTKTISIPIEQTTPITTIKSFSNSLKGGNIESATNTLDGAEVNISSLKESFSNVSPQKVYSTLFQKLEITCSDEKIDGNTASVKVNIKNVNIMAAMFALSYSGEEISDSKTLLEYFNKSIKNVTLEELEVTANLIKKDDKWYIAENNDTFLMAMMGVDENSLDNSLEEE